MSDHVQQRSYQTKDAARLLGIPYRTLMDLIHAGEIGAVRAGRYYLVPAEEIDRFLKPAIKAAS